MLKNMILTENVRNDVVWISDTDSLEPSQELFFETGSVFCLKHCWSALVTILLMDRYNCGNYYTEEF